MKRHDELGRSGLSRVLAVVSKLLEPGESESGGLFVGDLVLHLIRTAGNSLGDILPGLLTAFVSRLATAQTASFSQVRSSRFVLYRRSVPSRALMRAEAYMFLENHRVLYSHLRT